MRLSKQNARTWKFPINMKIRTKLHCVRLPSGHWTSRIGTNKSSPALRGRSCVRDDPTTPLHFTSFISKYLFYNKPPTSLHFLTKKKSNRGFSKNSFNYLVLFYEICYNYWESRHVILYFCLVELVFWALSSFFLNFPSYLGA